MTVDKKSSPLTSRWRAGDQLRVRGERWRVRTATPGEGCTALRLLRAIAWSRPPLTPGEMLRSTNGAPGTEARAANRHDDRILLTPFDRPRACNVRHPARIVRTSAFLDVLRRMDSALHPASGLRAAAGAAIQLMPHQLEPSLSAVVCGTTRILVADEVGLGKTIQAGLLIAELAASSGELRALVLVPAGLREQWRSELVQHFGLMPVDADAGWLRSVSMERPADVNPWALGGVYVASHDFVKRPEVLRALEDVIWDLVVVDEAHAMGAGTDRRAAAHAIALRSRRVLLLTATPPWDDPIAFDALCDIGRGNVDRAPVMLFHRRRGDVAPGAGRRSAVVKIRPSAAERRMHTLLERYTARVWAESRRRGDSSASLVAIVLRKRALSSAASLAQSVRRRLDLLGRTVEPDSEQLILPFADEDPLADAEPEAVLAVPGLSDPRQEGRWLSAIGAAAEAAARHETKASRLVRLLACLQEPVIVFTEFRDTLLRLQRALTSAGRRVLVMHGGMSARLRSDVQREFNDGAAVLLATDAASEGLNLHVRCRVLVHYELPWSPTRLAQRAGRVDRLGQTRRVHEIAFVALDTAERLVLAPLLRRAARSGQTGGPAGILHTLTEARLAESILEGTPLPADIVLPAPQTVSAAPPALEPEAATEVRRLEQRRRSLRVTGTCAATTSEDCRRALLVITPTGTRDLVPGLSLIYATVVFGPDGVQLHGAPLLVRVAIGRASRIYRRTSELRRSLRTLVERPPDAVREVLEASAARARLEAAVVHERRRAQLHRREADIRRVCVSAATQLVQAGLFDRRSLKAVEHRVRVKEAQLSSLGEESDFAAAELEVDTSLVAAVLVRPARQSAT